MPLVSPFVSPIASPIEGTWGASRAWAPRFLDTFSTLTPGANATLPGDWAVACATSNTTCRTSASTIATGIAADTARVETDGTNTGVLVEPATTNLLAALVSQGLGNAGSGVSYPGGDIAGPSGVAGTGERTTVSSGGYSKYDAPAFASSIGCTLTEWVRSVSGTVVAQLNVNALAANNATSETVGTTWARIFRSTLPNASLVSAVFVPVDARDMSASGGTTAHAIDCYLAALQAEALPGPTSLIGAGLTRAGTRLYHADLSKFVRGGRMRLEIGASLLWDSSQLPATAVTLLQIDASNKITLTPTAVATTPSGLTAAIVIGGTTYTCPTLIRAWRGDALDFYAEWGNGVSSLWYRLNSGPWILVGTSAATFASLASSGTLDLCCSGTASQLPAIVTYVRGW
jgi:hypothetical protein